MTILTLWFEGDFGPVIAGILGLAWGLASDRLAARWPAHEDGSVRPIDWRTPVVGVLGAAETVREEFLISMSGRRPRT